MAHESAPITKTIIANLRQLQQSHDVAITVHAAFDPTTRRAFCEAYDAHRSWYARVDADSPHDPLSVAQEKLHATVVARLRDFIPFPPTFSVPR